MGLCVCLHQNIISSLKMLFQCLSVSERSSGVWVIRSVMESSGRVFYFRVSGVSPAFLPLCCTVPGQALVFGKPVLAVKFWAHISSNRCWPVHRCRSSLTGVCLHSLQTSQQTLIHIGSCAQNAHFLFLWKPACGIQRSTLRASHNAMRRTWSFSVSVNAEFIFICAVSDVYAGLSHISTLHRPVHSLLLFQDSFSLGNPLDSYDTGLLLKQFVCKG